MDAQLLGSLAVFLQIIDEEGFVGMDVRLSDYLLIDVGIRFCQMHSLREETVLEIILYPMVLIREEMLHAIIPMYINGITQEEEAVTSLLQLQESLLFLINMWMLLIVKLLSFKRYNYPFYKCRENGRQMQCAYSQPVSDKVVPLLFSLYCKILETNAMHCFSASSVSCVTERLSGCKDTTLCWNIDGKIC